MLTEFATWMKTYRRISLDDLAKKLGTTPMQTERTLAQAIERGLLKGVVDRSTDEFVVQRTEAQQICIRTCPALRWRRGRVAVPGGALHLSVLPHGRRCVCDGRSIEVTRDPRHP